MQIELTTAAKDQLSFWQKTGNKAILYKIDKLIDDIIDTPYQGLGKPEALKYNLTGCWSRRINQEHRLVYRVTEDLITILSVKGHY
ncbi:MAG: Txe/YoeB family addiction module toxin [Sphingobacteriales bacterium]|nr:MAG: Txe/YoeB family addiction module toxin [Sphingobacteriales bacterium]